jgi:universal stress protein A
MKTQRVVCPVDFSECSEAALELTTRLALDGDSQVFLLHVAPEDQSRVSLVEAQTNKLQERIRNRRLLESGIPFQEFTVYGSPAEMIVKFARQKNADLIVMGTHGRTGLSRVFLGSVAQSVMQAAPCVVVAVKPSAAEA